ncbi:Trypsin domain protein [Verrucomicrobiia bacterium DG1235]|nr:Trypsin domain protein [Verrucomicrobiae bacterium DG1235]
MRHLKRIPFRIQSPDRPPFAKSSLNKSSIPNSYVTKLALSAIASLAISASCLADDLIKPSIVGGRDAADGAFPWIAALVRADGAGNATERQFCGGALIAPNWILTAAHCIDEQPPTGFEIIVGQNDLDDAYTPVFPRSIHTHPSYHFRRLGRGSDLALIEIDPPVLDYPPVSINRALDRIVAGREVTALGWGRTDYNSNDDTNTLQQVELTLRDIDEYDDNHPAYDYFISTELNETEKGIYSGDSGGPLLIQSEDGEDWLIAGLTSNSIRNADNSLNVPFFTNVASVQDWIDRVLSSTDTVPESIPLLERVKPAKHPNGQSYAGYRIWPFAGQRKETLNLNANSAFDFLLWYPNSLQALNDGSFLIFDTRNELSQAPSIAELSIEHSRNYIDPLFTLAPFENAFFSRIRGNSSRTDHYASFTFDGLLPNQSYHLIGESSSQLYRQDPGNIELTTTYENPFPASPDSNYWLHLNPTSASKFITLLPEATHTLNSNQEASGILSSNSHPFRSPSTRIELFKANNLPGTNESLITLLPEFDGELILYSTNDGREIAYADQGAENETDELIIATADLYNSIIGVYNFDKDATGSFKLDLEPHVPASLAFGVEQRRGITSADEYFTDSNGKRITYESLTITNTRNYPFITVRVYGSYFDPGVAIYDGDGERLEFEFGEQLHTITFAAKARERYTIDVLNYEGPYVQNYEILVSGSQTQP